MTNEVQRIVQAIPTEPDCSLKDRDKDWQLADYAELGAWKAMLRALSQGKVCFITAYRREIERNGSEEKEEYRYLDKQCMIELLR